MKKATMTAIVLIITVCLLFTVTVIVKAQVTEEPQEEALTLEQICERTELRQRRDKFEEVMAYLDQYYPNRTVGEEIELLKKFCNPIVLTDNGPASIDILDVDYSEEDIEMLQKIDDAECDLYLEEEQDAHEIEIIKTRILERVAKEAWYKNYTEQDIYMLAVVMFAEMEEYMNDVDAEKVAKAVASVVLHRVMSQGYYPNDIKSVLWQNYGKRGQQYASRTLNMINQGVEPPKEFYRWAEDLLIEGPIGPDNLVFQDNQPHGDIWWKYGKIYFCTANL